MQENDPISNSALPAAAVSQPPCKSHGIPEALTRGNVLICLENGKYHVLFVDSDHVDIQAAMEWPLQIQIVAIDAGSKSVSECIAHEDRACYDRNIAELVAAERERCATVAEDAAKLLRRWLSAVHPMRQSTLETTAELLESVGAKIRIGEPPSGNPFSAYTREEMNSILRGEREVGAKVERERCAKIADDAELGDALSDGELSRQLRFQREIVAKIRSGE